MSKPDPKSYGYDHVKLSTLANGGVEELFQNKLQEVMQNIHNLNTEPDAKRKITITLAFLPNEERTAIAVSCAVAATVAGIKGTSTLLVTNDAKQDGKFPVYEHNPQQMKLSQIETIVARAAESVAAEEKPATPPAQA